MGAYQSNLADESIKQNRVDFLINGKQFCVDTTLGSPSISAESKLVDFIRDTAGLKGTKYMCREGGCGACVVSVKERDVNTGKEIVRAVNSCLVPVLSADGWDITTVEGLGSRKSGYHQIQDQIVKFSGTQCGFCTPGMLMNFYSLTQSKPSFKAQDVEDSMCGNICRCTGYRPIMDCFKSMAGDASEELRRKNTEANLKSCGEGGRGGGVGEGCCKKDKQVGVGEGEGAPVVTDPDADLEELVPPQRNPNSNLNSKLYLQLGTGTGVGVGGGDGGEWIRVTSLSTLFDSLQHFLSSGRKYRIVAGNTGTGVYKDEGPFNGYIDINGVGELKGSSLGPSGVEIGSGVTLAEGITSFQKGSSLDGYFYLAQMSKHLTRVANTPVRNKATLGGNLMLKHTHREFPSDVFVLLETVGAKLKIGSSVSVFREYSPSEFLQTDMRGKIIISIKFPPYKGGNYFFRSFKITRRYQNSHAYVNAGLLMKVDPKRNFSVRDKPNIVFGGIHPDFVHATGTEMYFLGKFLNQKSIRGAMEVLEKEIQPNVKPPDAEPSYRKRLTQALLYKFLLGILGDTVKGKNQSGIHEIERSLSYGKQDFDTDQSQWPLYQPISKLEAKVQASGEAEYINDMHPRFGELHAAFVLTTVANAKLGSVDASEALLIPGVANFIQAKDVPGVNNHAIFYAEAEEVFLPLDGKVRHAGQAIGLILADSRETALSAAKKVAISYTDVQKPILDIETSLTVNNFRDREKECILTLKKTAIEIESSSASENVGVGGGTRIKGEFRTGAQYHFHMETQNCLCIPREDGMDVFSGTQFPNSVQTIVAFNLAVPVNNILVSVRRLGGGFGSKITKATHIAAACAVAANAVNRPVRLVLDLETNMKLIGKRLPYFAKYEAEVENSGKIVNLKCEIFCDPGWTANEETSVFAFLCAQNCYGAVGWQVIPGKAITNTHANTYCRAPGSTQGIAITETIMDHVAFALKMDPLELRQTNFIKAGDPLLAIPGEKFHGENPLPGIIQQLKSSADYSDRKAFADNFNQNNRWKKRGLSILPMRYPQHYPDIFLRFPVFISVYAGDGSVCISHAGIEMGQGINTKCAQVVAHKLNIPIEKVLVTPTNTLISPNSGLTGAALTSELICHAALKACDQLLAKMEPVKAEMKDVPWEKIVGGCYAKHILLTAQHMDKPGDVIPYDVWGVTMTEVEVDVLTGEYKIVRVDLLEDVGKSLSPNVDIGQIEGAFIMGLGLWTTEKLVYDKSTGELLTCNSWEYKVPMSRDIPEDFRVTMIRKRENPYGVLGSKATGEPPVCMAYSVVSALRHAITSARSDSGNTNWFRMDGPVTPEDIQRLALTSKEQFDI